MIITENGKQQYETNTSFEFAQGGTIPRLVLHFETYGTLNTEKSNAILIHHALSTHSHVSSHADNQTPGWWEKMVGPGCPIDTNQYFVICINNLGSCFGSSSPVTINPQTGHAYRMTFPRLSIEDIARSQKQLIDALAIEQLHAVIGPSMGGMISLQFAALYPESVKHLISISSCMRTHPSNKAIRQIQRDIIRLDPQWQQGEYDNNTLQGFHIARKLAHFGYRNDDELDNRFLEPQPNGNTVHTYLDYNAQKFTRTFDANCYLYLTQAMDDFDLSQSELLQKIKAKTFVISVDSDTLFKPQQQLELYETLKQVGNDTLYQIHRSRYGHDTFLVEIDAIGNYITDFIA